MISAILPTYNEEKNVRQLHGELVSALRSIGEDFEIIFINDGSTDGTLEELKKCSPVRIVNFRRRFGQTAAFDAGFKAARGETIVTLDADLQNDPADIPRLYEKLTEGHDVVCGWRHERQDPFAKRFFSWGARRLRGFLLGDYIHDSGCSLRAYRREAVQHLDLYGEMHRFITSILMFKGFDIVEIHVRHRPRVHGTTKYGWKRSVKGFIDMVNLWFLYKYRARPLHLFGGAGLFLLVVGSLLTAYFGIARLVFGVPLAGRTLPVASLFLVLFGIQLFVTGLLADIAVKNYYNVAKEKSYLIKEEIVNG